MSGVLPIHVSFSVEGEAAALLSVRTALEAVADGGLAPCGRLAERFPSFIHADGEGGFELAANIADLILSNDMDFATGGAGEIVARIKPSERYAEFVAAIAAERNLDVVESHGWPVLSLGAAMPSVTEAGEAHNLSGGGAA